MASKSPATLSEDFIKFLIACYKYNDGKVDADKVAEACGISKITVATRTIRLKQKIEGMDLKSTDSRLSGAATPKKVVKTKDDSEGAPKPVRKRKAVGAVGDGEGESKKKKKAGTKKSGERGETTDKVMVKVESELEAESEHCV